MAILQMAKGPSGSGKSTYFDNVLRDRGNWIRVGRDFLRPMLYGRGAKHKHEDITIAVEQGIVTYLAMTGMSIFIDDTNLTPRHKELWATVAENIGYKFQIKEFHTPIADCVAVDVLREGKAQVGLPVIHHQFLLSGFIKWGDAPISIFDLDGTLADNSHRQTLKGGKKQFWAEFHKKAIDDVVNIAILDELLARKDKGHTIVIGTGRNMNHVGPVTAAWLDKNPIPYDYLFMSPDRILGSEWKKKMLELILAQTKPGQIVDAFDDDPLAIEVYRNAGLKAYHVGDRAEVLEAVLATIS